MAVPEKPGREIPESVGSEGRIDVVAVGISNVSETGTFPLWDDVTVSIAVETE